MWKQVLGTLAVIGILSCVASIGACGGEAKQVKPSGTDGGTTAPVTSESQPSPH